MNNPISHRVILRKSLGVLDAKDKNSLLIALGIQFLLGLFDVVAITLFGLLGTIGVSYVAGVALPNWLIVILEVVNLEQLTLQNLLMTVALLSSLLLVAKSIMSLVFSYLFTGFMARKQVVLSSNLVETLSQIPYSWLRKKNLQELVYASTEGMNSLVVGVISNFIMLISEVFLLLLITVLLFYVQPTTALLTVVFFTIVALTLNRVLVRVATKSGAGYAKTSITGRNQILNLMSSYKEIFTLKCRAIYVERFSATRLENATHFGTGLWIQQLPKYLLEIALVIGGSSLVAYQAWQDSASGGLSVLLVFLVSATRLTPAILRIQTSLISIRNFWPGAETTLELLDELKQFIIETDQGQINKKTIINPPKIIVRGLSFRYPDSEKDTLSNLHFVIQPGSINALVGVSGSGKTTLVDLLLGIYEPVQGSVELLVDDHSFKPRQFQHTAYVPQAPFIMDTSLRENIAIGIERFDIDEERLQYVLEISGLGEIIDKFPDGLDTQLSGFRDQLSGGEKQRLAIARALYSNPKFLVIDEGTSSLDAFGEDFIMKKLLDLKDKVTVLLIAHRLSSIKNVDCIFFLQDGKILGDGNFMELQARVPDFARKVELMSVPRNNTFL